MTSSLYPAGYHQKALLFQTLSSLLLRVPGFLGNPHCWDSTELGKQGSSQSQDHRGKTLTTATCSQMFHISSDALPSLDLLESSSLCEYIGHGVLEHSLYKPLMLRASRLCVNCSGPYHLNTEQTCSLLTSSRLWHYLDLSPPRPLNQKESIKLHPFSVSPSSTGLKPTFQTTVISFSLCFVNSSIPIDV